LLWENIVNFQCGHCKALAPDWEKLAAEWEGHDTGLVAEVDCTEEDAEIICQDFGIEGYPTLLYGDPHTPENYEGGRDYESLSEFAKEHISKPVCSVRKIEVCDDETKALIEDLRKKTDDDLLAVEETVKQRIETAQTNYEAAVEKLSAEYEELTKGFQDEMDAARIDNNLKWVQQILSERGVKDKPSEEKNDEL
jgi:thioredoxin-like negative regulator of GroEL